MGSKWKKVKVALGLNTCLYGPRTLDESLPSMAARFSDVVSPATLLSPASYGLNSSSSSLRLSKSITRSSKKICAICLTAMKPGKGHAIFTAECSHSFHFHCITSNVKHGNQVCPVCRAKWKEIPFQSPASDPPIGISRINQIDWPRDDSWMTVLRGLPPPPPDAPRRISSLSHAPEPAIFDDDEALDHLSDVYDRETSIVDSVDNSIGTVEVQTYPEIPAVARSESHENFTVLVHVKASLESQMQNFTQNQTPFPSLSRAPVDLVTVLDVSGSMAGTKLALLKRAMGFVIQSLSSSDRLSVISFSSTARRIFPLRRMTDNGRQQALQAINNLVSNGGTNIIEGLKKGTKALLERKWKNSVCSIMLLSDGQDTYSFSSAGCSRSQADFLSLLPESIHRHSSTSLQIPVHSFGFGADHDATAMHSISETSGGTFSFVEAEGTIQDAFAQCIGGLLSVAVQELQVKIECLHSGLKFESLKAGNYKASITTGARIAAIDVGDLYAEEERDFLVTVNIPADSAIDEMPLLRVNCVYRKPITKETVRLQEASKVIIKRPDSTGKLSVSKEVDRQRNRVHAVESMAKARASAERGDLAAAVSVLENCYRTLSDSVSGKNGDHLCAALCAELKEMKERMENRSVYEASGRAYVLSGLSSHSWQRATARGDSTRSGSLVQAYQTSTMVDMVTRSQTMLFGDPNSNSTPQRTLRPAMTFPARTRHR